GGPGDVVAGGDDHVVAAGLVPEVSVRVADVGVAGDVPAVLHVVGLPRVGQVAASGRPHHGEPLGHAVHHRSAGLAAHHGPLAHGVRHRAAGIVDDRGPIARHGAAGRARPDIVVGGGDEHVHHLGRADAVDDLQPGTVVNLLPDGCGEVFTGRHRTAQPSER